MQRLEHLAHRVDERVEADELGVILAGANIVSVLHDDIDAVVRARTAIRTRLSAS